jgi:hypothetical protein
MGLRHYKSDAAAKKVSSTQFSACHHSLYVWQNGAMMIRQKGFRIGDTVKLHDLEKFGSGNAYPLPDGWHDGQAVTVLAFDRGWATVRDEAGRETEVYLVNLDTGWEEEYAPWEMAGAFQQFQPDQSTGTLSGTAR